MAVVGAQLGGDCVPQDSNHTLYFDASSSPAWEVVVQAAGHLQFLDHRSGILLDALVSRACRPAGWVEGGFTPRLAPTPPCSMCLAEPARHGRRFDCSPDPALPPHALQCAAGSADDAAVRELTQTVMVAFAETFVRTSSSCGALGLRVGLDSDGHLAAGLAPLNAIRRLFQAEENFARLGLTVDSRFKNFSLLEEAAC